MISCFDIILLVWYRYSIIIKGDFSKMKSKNQITFDSKGHVNYIPKPYDSDEQEVTFRKVQVLYYPGCSMENQEPYWFFEFRDQVINVDPDCFNEEDKRKAIESDEEGLFYRELSGTIYSDKTEWQFAIS